MLTIIKALCYLALTIIMAQSKGIAMDYNPYDIAYPQINNMNNISDKTLNNIVKNSGIN